MLFIPGKFRKILLYHLKLEDAGYSAFEMVLLLVDGKERVNIVSFCEICFCSGWLSLIFFFIFCFFVCTGRVPDPTSLFLPTSFCM